MNSRYGMILSEKLHFVRAFEVLASISVTPVGVIAA